MIRNHISSLLASTAMWAPPDERKPQGQHTTTEVDTGSGQTGFSGSISMDVGGEETVKFTDKESTVDHIEVGNGSEDANADGLEQEPEAPAEGEGDDTTTTEEDAGDEAPAAVEVPEEFKADDPEVVAQFDKALKREDGKLNMDALSAQWWGNQQAAEDGNGHLTDSTYDYLDSLGIPKEMVQAAEAGQAALNTVGNQKLYARAGGKPNLDAAIAWAATGDKAAYSPAQQDAFNRAIAKGGDVAVDAIDLLMSRHEKGTKASTSPKKSAGEHASAGGDQNPKVADTFKNRDEWIAARKEAGRDMNKQAAVSKKFRNSPGAASWA